MQKLGDTVLACLCVFPSLYIKISNRLTVTLNTTFKVKLSDGRTSTTDHLIETIQFKMAAIVNRP